MKFTNTSKRTLVIDLGDGTRTIEPGQVTDVAEKYAYVVALRGYPLTPESQPEPIELPVDLPIVEPEKKTRK